MVVVDPLHIAAVPVIALVGRGFTTMVVADETALWHPKALVTRTV